LVPRWYNFVLIFVVKKGTGSATFGSHITVSPEMDIATVASTLERLNRDQLRTVSNYLNWAYPVFEYDNDEKTFTIKFTPYNSAANPITGFIITLGAVGKDFYEMLNVPESERGTYKYDASNPNASYPVMTFRNVWNRRPDELYFHASFVNHTQFNYLGRANDFYPKPSKIFTADNLPMDFYFWTTTNIIRPIVLRYERFIVELAFIIDSQDYQSP
jgi:hypothetical protein